MSSDPIQRNVNQTKSHISEMSFRRDQVIQIINSVISQVKEPKEYNRETLAEELLELKSIIENMRKQVRASDISQNDVPTATDELKAIVTGTEEASGTIMDSCEKIIEANATNESNLSEVIEAETTRIFEACSFQDITGQRITKVITAIEEIEAKVGHLIAAIDPSHDGTQTPVQKEDNRTEDEKLLNGPQMPDKAISQDDIDALLASFDDD